MLVYNFLRKRKIIKLNNFLKYRIIQKWILRYFYFVIQIYEANKLGVEYISNPLHRRRESLNIIYIIINT